MGIKYELANDIMERLADLAKTLSMDHVRLSGVYAVRSRGSGSRGTLGRCHALSKIWQLALGIKAIYIIEILSERFDRMSREEQDKVLIHELMHIPFSFGGGFKHHDVVTERNVDKVFQHYKKLKGYKDEEDEEKQEKKGISHWF